MKKENFKTELLKGGTQNQTTKKITKKDSIVVKKESKKINKDLVKEIRFILSLDKDTEKHFPSIIKYDIKMPVYYEMQWYKMKTIKKSIRDRDMDASLCIKSLKKILSFMFENVFSKNVQKTEKDYLNKTVFSRINERHNKVAKDSTILKKFITAEKIIIEGKEYRNLTELIEKIKKSKETIAMLTPKKTHMIHGDFHFDNFLVNPKNINEFILIDPKGESRGYNYTYDLGKLWHSFHGMYDLLHDELFDLEYKRDKKIMVVSKFSLKRGIFSEVCDDIYKQRKELLDICVKNSIEKNIELQIMFNDAAHFCALAPFHLLDNNIEKYPIGRYLTGVKLLNRLADKLNI